MEHDIIYMYIHKRKSLQKSVARGEGVVQGGISQHIIWLVSYMYFSTNNLKEIAGLFNLFCIHYDKVHCRL